MIMDIIGGLEEILPKTKKVNTQKLIKNIFKRFNKIKKTGTIFTGDPTIEIKDSSINIKYNNNIMFGVTRYNNTIMIGIYMGDDLVYDLIIREDGYMGTKNYKNVDLTGYSPRILKYIENILKKI